MPRHLALFILFCALAIPAQAQVAQPRGVTLLSGATASHHASAGARPPLTTAADESRRSAGEWIGIGALGGAAAGGVWGASVRPDGMFPVPLVWAGAIVGALAGAVVGAILYGITR